MKILGIDYGTKRIGLAMTDDDGKFGLPLEVVENNDEFVEKIRSLAHEREFKEVVIGESRDYKGKENKIQKDVQKLKEKLEAVGLTVHLEPEFMTSVHAERFQGKTDLVDSSAAALILQSFIDKRNS